MNATPQGTSSPLNFEDISKITRGEIKRYRTLLLIGGIGWLLFGSIFSQQGFADPPAPRYLVSGIVLSLFALSFAVAWVRRNFLAVVYAVFYLASAHITYLNYLNDIPFELLLAANNIFIITSIFFKTRKPLLFYLATLVVLMLVANILTAEDFEDGASKMGTVIIMTGSALTFLTIKFQTFNDLKEKTDVLNTLFDESHDAVVIADVQTDVVTAVNPKAVMLFEARDGQELVGLPVLELLRLAYSKARAKAVKHTVSKEGRWEDDVKFKTLKGNLFWGNQAIKTITIGNRKSFYFRISDITDRVMGEKAVRDVEIKYKMLMEDASDAIYLYNDQGDILDANSKASSLFGYGREEVVGKNMSMLISTEEEHPEDRLVMRDGAKGEIFEMRFLNKEGQPVDVEVSANRVYTNLHQAILRDITSRKEFEEALRRSEQKFRALIENSYDIVLILDSSFTIKYVSASIERPFGQAAATFQDRHLSTLVGKEYMETLQEVLDSAASKYGDMSGLEEILVEDKDGEALVFDAVVTNLLNDDVVDGIVLNLHDITDRKTTEQELRKTNFELDSFVYKASHDIRAPLLSIVGLINIAEGKPLEEVNQYIALMRRSASKLDKFITDLTHFSRNDRMEIKDEVVDFQALIDESMANLKFMKYVERITPNIEVNGDIDFYGDSMRMSIIFNNLISNAFKYQDISKETPSVWVVVEKAEDCCTIKVADNGIGIEDKYQPKIFEMFFRATELSEGSGLGLYIVKNVIDKLHGNITVRSTYSEGTSFEIWLPNHASQVVEQEKASGKHRLKLLKKLDTV